MRRGSQTITACLESTTTSPPTRARMRLPVGWERSSGRAANRWWARSSAISRRSTFGQPGRKRRCDGGVDGAIPYPWGVDRSSPTPSRRSTRRRRRCCCGPGSAVATARRRGSVAADPALTTSSPTGRAETGPEHDHTVVVDVDGLEPATTLLVPLRRRRRRVAGRADPHAAGRAGRPVPHRHGLLRPLRRGAARRVPGARRARGRPRRCTSATTSTRRPAPDGHRRARPAPRRRHASTTTAGAWPRCAPIPTPRRCTCATRWSAIWDDHDFCDNAWRDGAKRHDPDRARPVVRSGRRPRRGPARSGCRRAAATRRRSARDVAVAGHRRPRRAGPARHPARSAATARPATTARQAARRPRPLAARRRAARLAGRAPRRRDPAVVDRGQRRRGQRARAALAAAAALDRAAGAERLRRSSTAGSCTTTSGTATRPSATGSSTGCATGPTPAGARAAVRRRALVVGVRRPDRPSARWRRSRSSSRRRRCHRRRWAGPSTRGCGGCSTGRPIAWTTSCGPTSPTAATRSSRSRRTRCSSRVVVRPPLRRRSGGAGRAGRRLHDPGPGLAAAPRRRVERAVAEPSRPGLPAGLPPRPADLPTIRRHRRVRIATKAIGRRWRPLPPRSA